MNTPTAYPLQWPKGWPQTASDKREKGKFQSTLASALNSLQDEVRRLGGVGLVLSSNATLGVSNPEDPGVVAYFTYDKASVAIPCDRWNRIEHNVKAIALTIEAMRGMERWGAKHMIKAMFTGFKALPAPSTPHWSRLLVVNKNADRDEVHRAYKDAARIAHPDNGGDGTKMSEINTAWDDAKKERGWS